jgi:hypothetical protein
VLSRFGALLLLLAPFSASAFTSLTIVDDFQSRPQILTLPGTTGFLSDTVSGGATIIGSRRTMEFTISSNPLASTSETTVTQGANGLFTMNLGNGAIANTRLLYQGPDGSGLGGMDFTEGGHNSFAFRVSSLNQPTLLSLVITDLDGHMAMLNSSLPGSPATMSTHSYTFDSFENATATDFTQVDSFSVQFSADQPGTQLSLESISFGSLALAVAPEPNQLLLLAIAFAALAGQRRRPSIDTCAPS